MRYTSFHTVLAQTWQICEGNTLTQAIFFTEFDYREQFYSMGSHLVMFKFCLYKVYKASTKNTNAIIMYCKYRAFFCTIEYLGNLLTHQRDHYCPGNINLKDLSEASLNMRMYLMLFTVKY